MRHRTVEGVGINDADYPVDKGKCPYYQVWLSMLQRCYSERCQKKWPNYIGCSVASEWHLFSSFKTWMKTQNWEGKVLDKDIKVPGNKVYGPNNCLFVTQTINTLLNTQINQRGSLPIGVVRHNDKFKVTLKKNKKTVHGGVFNTVQEAAEAYRQLKADWIRKHADQESCPATRKALFNAAERYRSVKS